ncbi:MAG: WG repeat-containing protein, partial [Candidatus Obscuribacterales bacterium]|nr:WG repeat-containing protein [Candidatus Obscuribacterales bacterium]
MALPFLNKDSKEKEKKAKKTKQMVTLVLFIVAIGIFGAIFYKLDKEHLSVDSVLNPKRAASVQEPLPIAPAPMGPVLPACKYEHWNPFFFKDKLIYCDHNYQSHVKTSIDASKVVAADRFSDGMARILVKTSEVDTAYIYVDTTGKEVISANSGWDYCGPFSEGLACVEDKQTGLLGFIDKKGKFAIKPRYHVSVFVSGNVVHKQDQLDNTIFSNGLAPVYDDKVNAAGNKPACGFIDHKGKFVIPITYLQAYPFVDQRARVCMKDDSRWQKRWGYIDMKGKFVLKPVYIEVKDFTEGLAAVLDYKGQWGFIDKGGNYAIPAKFSGASSF